MQRPVVTRHVSVAVPVVLLLWYGWGQRWIGDDGFINLRVVNQLLAGNGFVFNVGERVEAVTSPLWVFLLALVGKSGVRLEDAAIALGMVLTGTGLMLLCYASARSYRSDDAPSGLVFLPFGALAYAATPAAWDYVTSGLENSLGLCWLGSGAWLTASVEQKGTRRIALLAALVVGLGPVVRPDYALLGLPLGVVLLSLVRGTKPRIEVACAGVLPGALYQVFRMGYFASLVPNTAFAKEAFEASWEQGRHYLWNTVGLYYLLVPFACVLLGLGLTSRVHPAARMRWALMLGGLLHILYIVRVGGDFMHARLLLPGLAAVFGSVALVPIAPSVSTQSLARAFASVALAGWAVFCVTSLRVDPENEFGIGDERGWFARMAQVDNPTRIEDYAKFGFHSSSVDIKQRVARGCPNGLADLEDDATESCRRVAILTPNAGRLSDGKHVLPLPLAPEADPKVVAVVTVGPLGIPGMVLGLRVNLADLFGLAEPVAARMLLVRRGRPGHEKSFDAPWFVARHAVESATRDPREHHARAAMSCGGIAALTRATREPLTAARFFANLKLAFQLHSLRVPPDPAQARQALCGS